MGGAGVSIGTGAGSAGRGAASGGGGCDLVVLATASAGMATASTGASGHEEPFSTYLTDRTVIIRLSSLYISTLISASNDHD